MATVTAIGPAFAIDGPLPVAPAYRLLSVPGVLADGSDRWLNGVNVWGYPCGTPSNWDPCFSVSSDSDTKDTDSEWNVPRFDAFQTYLPISCRMGHLGDPEEFAQRAVVALNAKVSFPIANALADGSGVSTNPFFADTNMTTPAGGGAVTPQAGLGYLEGAIGATGAEGLIHLTPEVAASLGYSYLETDGQVAHVLGTGSPVSVDGGYRGITPIGQAAAAAGQSWIFATGPVRVYMTEAELIPPSVSQALDRSDNTLTYRAEVSVLAMWDTCLQAGVLVDWTP